jgi:hypothetical protein
VDRREQGGGDGERFDSLKSASDGDGAHFISFRKAGSVQYTHSYIHLASLFQLCEFARP